MLAPAVAAATVAVSSLRAERPPSIRAAASSGTNAPEMRPAPRIAFPDGAVDFSYGRKATVGSERATAEATESKLFYTDDNRWWAVLGTFRGGKPPGLYLYELVEGGWQARVRLPGADPWAKADAVYDSETSTASIAVRAKNSPTSGDVRASKLYQLRYEGSGRWGVPALPVIISPESPEALTLAVDGLGRLWTSFVSDAGEVRVAFKASDAEAFEYVPLPVDTVKPDDVSAVVSWGSAGAERIGVLWSDQVTRRFQFAWRDDQAPISEDSWNLETAYGGATTVGGCPTETSSACADDHVSVKAYGDRVFAAVKTSLNDAPIPDSTDPLILVLERSDDSSSWHAHPVVPVAARVTKPTLLLSPEVDGLYVFAPRRDGVYLWASSFEDPGFGSAIPWVRPASEGVATTTKQVVTESSGAVVGVSAHVRRVHVHNELQFVDTLSDAPTPPAPADGARPSP
ncbi:MAG: hypothetical protein ACRDJV_02965 [Actinomycetota bacterium]